MKLIDIIISATSNMLRSKVRTGLTVMAILIGAFTIALTVGISSGISTYIDKQLGNVGAENVLLIQPRLDVSLSSGPKKYDPEKRNNSVQGGLQSVMLTTKDINIIKKVSGLTNVQPVVVAAPEYITGKNQDKYQINARSYIEGTRFELVAGSLPDNTVKEMQILLPVSFVEPLGFASAEEAVGQKVTFAVKTPIGELENVSAVICGVQQQTLLAEGGASANKGLITKLIGVQTDGLPADVAEKYFAVSSQFAKGSSEDQLKDIKAELRNLGYAGRTVADQIGIVKSVIDAITYVLIFFGAIALLAASFGIVNTLFMSVQERTREIGLMKAMGMSSSRVFVLFSVEAILLGFWGSFIGSLLAMGVGRIANRLASENFLKDLPGFNFTEFPLPSVAIIMFIIMVIAFLSGTLPARRAARQDPIEALRYE